MCEQFAKISRLLLSVLVIAHSTLSDPLVFPELKESSIINGGPKETARSWTPVRGSIVFPPSKITNAGQLEYQRQDAARQESGKDASRSHDRQTKAFYFSDGSKKSQPQTNSYQSDSEFRPSQEYPIEPTRSVGSELAVKDVSKYSEPVNSPQPFVPSIKNKDTESPVKTYRHVKSDDVPAIQVVEVIKPSPPLLDHKDFLDAMEQLVERLDELELKIPDGDNNEEDKVKAHQSISEIKFALLGTKGKLEEDIATLTEKTISLEQRLSALEEITREWIDPNVLAQDYFGKTNGKRGALASCPAPFFSLDEKDLKSPCYFINTQPNFRKNWQDASTSCHDIKAKLAEPKSSDELMKLTDYLRFNRTDQLGGGYWTGGLNPGLMWLWPSAGISLSNIDPDLWLNSFSPTDTGTEDNGKCLRLTYDRTSQRYALQGTDCQRYLYFVCEYDLNVTTTYDNQRLDKSFRPSEELFPIQTTSPLPVNAPSTSEAPSTTVQPLPPPPPPTPNYVGVIGFKGVSRPANVNPLNLAIFGDGIQ